MEPEDQLRQEMETMRKEMDALRAELKTSRQDMRPIKTLASTVMIVIMITAVIIFIKEYFF
jgi:hypothetical protein